MADSAARLGELRDEIDRLDGQILALLAERVRLVLQIGDLKRASSLPVHDPGREKVVIDRLVSLASSPLDADMVKRVFEQIVAECRRIEQAHLDSR